MLGAYRTGTHPYELQLSGSASGVYFNELWVSGDGAALSEREEGGAAEVEILVGRRQPWIPVLIATRPGLQPYDGGSTLPAGLVAFLLRG